jgi:hypothetical protein
MTQSAEKNRPGQEGSRKPSQVKRIPILKLFDLLQAKLDSVAQAAHADILFGKR